jgi:hypothetical protein
MKRKHITIIDLKNLSEQIDWFYIAGILTRKKDKRGRKQEFTPVMCFKAFVLKAHLQIEDDTELARKLDENPEYPKFCGMHKSPSHDVLSDFRNNYAHKIRKAFDYFDELLERLGAFKNDALSTDGTDIPVPIKNRQPAHRYHFGANSSKKKFHGFWLMIMSSVNKQIPRSFEVGYAREGQINICKDMLNYRRVDDSEDNNLFFMDGIFDCQEIYSLVLEKQGKLPIINYNKRGSSYESIRELPEDDWRFLYNPLLHFPDFIVEEYKKRTCSERVNSHSKSYTLISRIANKVKKSKTILKSTVEHIVTFSFILEQMKLLSVLNDKLCQVTLSDF